MTENEQTKEPERENEFVYRQVYLATADKAIKLGIVTDKPVFVSHIHGVTCEECGQDVPPLVFEVGKPVVPLHRHEGESQRIFAFSRIGQAVRYPSIGFIAILTTSPGKFSKKYFDSYEYDGFGASTVRHEYVELDEARTSAIKEFSGFQQMELGTMPLRESRNYPGFLILGMD